MYFKTVWNRAWRSKHVIQNKNDVFLSWSYTVFVLATSNMFLYHSQIELARPSNLVQEIIVLLPRIDCTTIQDTFILQMGLIVCKRYASFLLPALCVFFLLFLLIKGFLFTANICYSVIMLQKIINVLSKENTWMHTWYLSFLVPSSRDMYKCTNAWQVSWEMSCSGHQHQFLQKGKRFGRAWQFAGEVSILT